MFSCQMADEQEALEQADEERDGIFKPLQQAVTIKHPEEQEKIPQRGFAYGTFVKKCRDSAVSEVRNAMIEE